jgi:hypothetical protein
MWIGRKHSSLSNWSFLASECHSQSLWEHDSVQIFPTLCMHINIAIFSRTSTLNYCTFEYTSSFCVIKLVKVVFWRYHNVEFIEIICTLITVTLWEGNAISNTSQYINDAKLTGLADPRSSENGQSDFWSWFHLPVWRHCGHRHGKWSILQTISQKFFFHQTLRGCSW